MDVKRYIGIPYVPGSESFEGADCYTLCRMVSRNELGIELPDLNMLYAAGSTTKDAKSAFSTWENDLAHEWIEVDEPEEGDIVLFKFYGVAMHCGMYIGNNMCLHASEGSGSHIERLYGTPWEQRIKGIIRYGTDC